MTEETVRASIQRLEDDIALLEQMRPGSPLLADYKKQLAACVAAGGKLSANSWFRTQLLTPDEPSPCGQGEKIMCLTPWLQRAYERERLHQRLRELIEMERDDSK